MQSVLRQLCVLTESSVCKVYVVPYRPSCRWKQLARQFQCGVKQGKRIPNVCWLWILPRFKLSIIFDPWLYQLNEHLKIKPLGRRRFKNIDSGGYWRLSTLLSTDRFHEAEGPRKTASPQREDDSSLQGCCCGGTPSVIIFLASYCARKGFCSAWRYFCTLAGNVRTIKLTLW